ncbi:Atxe2 family lasso peptide isopeptidase [Flavisphingomonas formosensis]|uniref:Atxe2 family lasso peptide isopeptidase n=1 Tax=Flavisphingomonas formosensis TaxID=861534 RepID=UPI0012FC3C74|nr:Atxe2 family lasso peptide isopeptidase [Sphingomonas formosensis]
MSFIRGLAVVALLACAVSGSRASAALMPSDPCSDLLPGPVTGYKRGLLAEDLVRLRDIGRPDGSLSGDSPIAISPDGQRVAFQLRRADPVTNSYCLAMIVMELRPGARPLIVDRGGSLILMTYDLWGMAEWESGTPRVITPRWSPDGQWIAFLKRVDGVTQVWRARFDGREARAVTRSADDVVAFAWAGDGGLFFSTRPDIAREKSDIEREGRSGFLFDDRFQALAGNRPMPRATATPAAFHVDAVSGQVRAAAPAEKAQLDASGDGGASPSSLTTATRDGERAWVAARDAGLYSSPTMISATLADQRTAHCTQAPCDRVVALWWPSGEHDILFLARTGWGRSALGLYRWNPATGRSRRILETEDLLIGCRMATTRLICLREGSATPRHIVAIDIMDGRAETIFDPNPDYAALRLGKVQRLHWRNDRGIECFGDLVLPPDHRAGQRHPMIVVQYQSRGLLRGGTGDEYPIQLFAAHGFAVLSVERPPEVGTFTPARDAVGFERANITGWADRTSVLSALLGGVHLAISRGAIDERRIGLSGLSDGVSTVQHALIATSMFSAVAISQCCDDPQIQTLYVGSQFADFLEQAGYPRAGEDRPDFWARHSLALNVEKVTAPILIQVADEEYRSALQTYAALRRYGKTVEMFVYPGEHHIKWQPAHRLAVYGRNLDWFSRWLRP